MIGDAALGGLLSVSGCAVVGMFFFPALAFIVGFSLIGLVAGAAGGALWGRGEGL